MGHAYGIPRNPLIPPPSGQGTVRGLQDPVTFCHNLRALDDYLDISSLSPCSEDPYQKKDVTFSETEEGKETSSSGFQSDAWLGYLVS